MLPSPSPNTIELGRIPNQGEQLCVAGLDIHIQEADPRRIVRVLIKAKR
ncbi:MAG: transporter associated domain-containing protein [Mariprofundaceae bacterium]|nr:transporter associated domain-containing protein [Mariprofundaceae bacterium]